MIIPITDVYGLLFCTISTLYFDFVLQRDTPSVPLYVANQSLVL